MMLDSLGIVCGIFRRHPQSQQKIVHRLVSFLATLRKPLASRSKHDRAVGFALDQAVSFEPRHGSVGRHMTDPKMGCDFLQSAFPIGLDQMGDGFDVIFRQFRGMFLAHAGVLLGWLSFFRHNKPLPNGFLSSDFLLSYILANSTVNGRLQLIVIPRCDSLQI